MPKTMPRTLARVLLFALALAAPAVRLRAQAPTDAEGLFSAGLTHLREGRAELALEAFKKAVKQDPKNAYFHKGLGQAYLTLKRYGDAVDAFRKAVEINPYYVDARSDLGTALVLQGKRLEGRKEYMAVFNDPTNPTPELTARNIGMTYFDEKKYTEALNWFRTALNRNKAYPEAHIRAADTLVAMGKLDEAILLLENALKTVPDDADLELGLGEAYYQAGRFSDARIRLERVAGRDPAGALGRRALDLLKNFPK